MITQYKNSTIILRVVCAILFFVFTFLYLFDFQADVLAFIQHVLSDGVTRYNRIIGAVLITLLLWIIQVIVFASSRICGYFHALTYLPSLLLLAVLTDVTDNLKHESYLGNWLWLFPLIILVYSAVLWVIRQYEVIHIKDRVTATYKLLWSNVLLMTAMFVITSQIGNNDKLFHYRLHMENELISGNVKDGNLVGAREEETDSSLTLLRVWTLSKRNELGEKLFNYALKGKSDAMLPNHRSVSLLMVPDRNLYKDLGIYFKEKMQPKQYLIKLHEKGYATTMAHDWLLCAYLLDGELDHFVKALPLYYPVDHNLPKHFREALTLYKHQKNNPNLVYKNSVMDTDFEDFQTMRRKYKYPQECYSALRDSYGKTYWFYYFMCIK